MQFSLPDADYIVDPLSTFSLEPLADVFASPAVEKIFHGADYDLVSLKRGYGFHFSSIFDTMVAARILGYKSIGLAALVAEHLGLHLDKTMQRSDWGQRPLSSGQLAYACQDTRYLFALRAHLLGELAEKNRIQEAQEAFADLASLEPKPRSFDADAFWNIKGVRDLDVTGQRIVRALHRWREDQARWEDRPSFKVMHDHTLVELAAANPAAPELLRRAHVLSTYQLTRYGHQVMEVIARARRETEPLAPPRPRNNGTRPDDETIGLYESLRTWRKERAQARGVEPDVIASNDVLMRVAMQRPRCLDDLAAVDGLGAWRRAEYGREILAVLLADESKGQPRRPRTRRRGHASPGA